MATAGTPPLPIVDRYRLRERTGFSLYRIKRALRAGKLPKPRKAIGLFWAESELPALRAALEAFGGEARTG